MLQSSARFQSSRRSLFPFLSPRYSARIFRARVSRIRHDMEARCSPSFRKNTVLLFVIFVFPSLSFSLRSLFAESPRDSFILQNGTIDEMSSDNLALTFHFRAYYFLLLLFCHVLESSHPQSSSSHSASRSRTRFRLRHTLSRTRPAPNSLHPVSIATQPWEIYEFISLDLILAV